MVKVKPTVNVKVMLNGSKVILEKGKIYEIEKDHADDLKRSGWVDEIR